MGDFFEIMDKNTLYYGDCLDWMQRWDGKSVDLIYLDPPFNSKANYNMLYSTAGGGDAQFRAFNDTWVWDEAAADRYTMYENAIAKPAHKAIVGLYQILGNSGMLAYLTYMAERIEQMHRLLKPTGSIYLHCDQTASHYIRILLDRIFGAKNFRREIIWTMSAASGFKSLAKNFIRGHDTIFYYAKNINKVKQKFNKTYLPYNEKQLKRFSGIDPDTGRKYKSITKTRRLYLDNAKGVPLTDVWTDIANFQTVVNSPEIMGYPTQKPLSLLDRIIKSSSTRGDIVLDPFCGCGTTVEAAMRLGRQFVGIDISSFAIDLIKKQRLNDPSIPTKGIPYDFASARKLAKENPFNFESWAVTRLEGFAPNTKQTGDGGVDGRATLAKKPDDYDSRLGLAQVKGGGKFNLSSLRDFIHVTDRDKAAVGCFITLNPVTSYAAKKEVVNTGTISISGYQYRRTQLWSVHDYFDDRLPSLPIMNDPYTGNPMIQRSLLLN